MVLSQPKPQEPEIEPAVSSTAIRHRPRRLRRTATMRRLVRETQLTLDDLIYPVFVREGTEIEEEIPSMPGIYRYSLDVLLKELAVVSRLGIRAIALFPLISSEQKDNAGTESYNPDGLVPRTVKAIKAQFPELLVMTDVALDPYSSTGHDGIRSPNQ